MARGYYPEGELRQLQARIGVLEAELAAAGFVEKKLDAVSRAEFERGFRAGRDAAADLAVKWDPDLGDALAKLLLKLEPPT